MDERHPHPSKSVPAAFLGSFLSGILIHSGNAESDQSEVGFVRWARFSAPLADGAHAHGCPSHRFGRVLERGARASQRWQPVFLRANVANRGRRGVERAQHVLVWNPAVDAGVLCATGRVELRTGVFCISNVQCDRAFAVQRESLATLWRPSERTVGGVASGHEFPSCARGPGIWQDGGIASPRNSVVHGVPRFQTAAGRGGDRADCAKAASTVSLLDCVPGVGGSGPALASVGGSRGGTGCRGPGSVDSAAADMGRVPAIHGIWCSAGVSEPDARYLASPLLRYGPTLATVLAQLRRHRVALALLGWTALYLGLEQAAACLAHGVGCHYFLYLAFRPNRAAAGVDRNCRVVEHDKQA